MFLVQIYFNDFELPQQQRSFQVLQFGEKINETNVMSQRAPIHRHFSVLQWNLFVFISSKKRPANNESAFSRKVAHLSRTERIERPNLNDGDESRFRFSSLFCLIHRIKGSAEERRDEEGNFISVTTEQLPTNHTASGGGHSEDHWVQRMNEDL